MNHRTRPLSPMAERLLAVSDKERMRHIRQPQWIGYPAAERVFDRLEYLYTSPPSPRMGNALIIGDTNNGKTVLARRFAELIKRREDAEPGRFHAPVLMVSAPTSCEAGHFYGSILRQLGAPYGARDHVGEKEFQVISLLRELGVGMLIIDELHEVVQGGPRKQRNILNIIKNLTNETQIPLVGLGTHAAQRAVEVDPQLANRFRRLTLPQWKLDADYLRLLASYEILLPLKKASNLAGKTIAKRILRMSEGLIGETSTIITEAAYLAVKSGEERINGAVLDALRWDPPTKRRGGD